MTEVRIYYDYLKEYIGRFKRDDKFPMMFSVFNIMIFAGNAVIHNNVNGDIIIADLILKIPFMPAMANIKIQEQFGVFDEL